MRISLAAASAALALIATGAAAETVQLNHLDCRFDEGTRSIVCPDVLTGRSAFEVSRQAQAQLQQPQPEEPEPAADSGPPEKGTEEWNKQCAAKYNSFSPETGTYTSYSGKTKPCRLF